ncbi:hypothetical protein QQ045_011694 [Rhodiola kirilowii]
MLCLKLVHRSASGCIPSLCIAVASWNGLVCLQSIFESPFVGSGKLSIWNPLTRQIFDIPRDENCFSSTDYRLGVAYGPECYDYKIYKIVRSPIKKGRQECRMYSSTTGCWKSLGLATSYPVYSYHVFVNGTVYWISSNVISGFPSAILSVDIVGKFLTFDSPVRGFGWPYLICLGGSLGLVDVRKELSAASQEVSVTSRMIVWVLESPPLPIWTKKFETYIPLFPLEQTIGAAASGNHVVVMTPERHLKFHIDTNAWTVVMSSKGVTDDTTFSCFFSKTLLPCDGVIES